MLTEPIENLLNLHLSRSPAAREHCARLQEQALGVHLTGLEQRFVLQSLGTSLKLTRDTTAMTAVDITGSPVNLLVMLTSDPQSETAQRLLSSGAIRVKGDTSLLQRYRELLALLQPDLPAALEQLLGDSTGARTVAHQVSQLMQSALGFSRHAARTAVLNAAEYLAHETGDLVPRAEAEPFLSAVDRLREDADRLHTRLRQLQQKMAPTEGASTEGAPTEGLPR